MYRHHKTAFFIAALLLTMLTNCGTNNNKASKYEQEAAKKAQYYYEQLLKGHYTYCIKGEFRSQHLPVSYQKQLKLNLEKFSKARFKDQAKIDSITISNTSALTKDSIVNVYLVLHRANKTKDQIIARMIKYKNRWLML
ncbi:hypothetical protein HMPREF1860_00883 [Prevotella amnii]|uniref:DUF4878 domain-containing protein n=1 Tax=Prevotella amnii TaxID=419005 RepID=A0A134BFM6_9BACT|nr:hypothetical protein [Prevotella amnii]KXB78753.1 hypothetical protein HMPREF1860_00883 [Prevotella amnii]